MIVISTQRGAKREHHGDFTLRFGMQLQMKVENWLGEKDVRTGLAQLTRAAALGYFRAT